MYLNDYMYMDNDDDMNLGDMYGNYGQMPMCPMCQRNQMNGMDYDFMDPVMQMQQPQPPMPQQPPMPIQPLMPMNPIVGGVIFPTAPYFPQMAINKALRLIVDAVSGEREDEMFYDYLIKEAPDKVQKDIIMSIRDDERKHGKMFRQMYFDLTGRQVPEARGEEFKKPTTYFDGLESALMGELGAVERYRQVMFGLTKRYMINMITEIMSDELKHASKYNYLITKNSVK